VAQHLDRRAGDGAAHAGARRARGRDSASSIATNCATFMYATARNAACCEEGLRPIAARAGAGPPHARGGVAGGDDVGVAVS
jgi:hypothetical protein